MFRRLTQLALIVSVMGIACPDNNSSCAVLCPGNGSATCSGTMDCTSNPQCMVSCNGTRSCSGFNVVGLSTNATTDYAVKCQGSYDCENAVFTSEASNGTTRFSCSGNYSCSNTTFNCNSTNCELLCDKDSNSCRDLSAFNCPGGLGKTCNVVCNGGGCNSTLNIVCATYPCDVRFSGTDAITPRCPAGQLTCAEECVANTSTACPSRCILNDPCNIIGHSANKCVDIGPVGNKYNCTCGAVGYKPTSINGLVQSCDVPLGYGTSLTITTYAKNDCSGATRSIRTYPVGCSNTSGSVQTYYTQCTAAKYCQRAMYGTCQSTTTYCTPTTLAGGSCVYGARARCNNVNNGAGTISAGASVLIMLLFSLFC